MLATVSSLEKGTSSCECGQPSWPSCALKTLHSPSTSEIAFLLSAAYLMVHSNIHKCNQPARPLCNSVERDASAADPRGRYQCEVAHLVVCSDLCDSRQTQLPPAVGAPREQEARGGYRRGVRCSRRQLGHWQRPQTVHQRRRPPGLLVTEAELPESIVAPGVHLQQPRASSWSVQNAE